MKIKDINGFSLQRRKFLCNAFLGGCILPFSNTVFAGLVESAILGKRRVIVYELKGGNDGLSTVVPYNDALYKKFRPTLALRIPTNIE